MFKEELSEKAMQEANTTSRSKHGKCKNYKNKVNGITEILFEIMSRVNSTWEYCFELKFCKRFITREKTFNP